MENAFLHTVSSSARKHFRYTVTFLLILHVNINYSQDNLKEIKPSNYLTLKIKSSQYKDQFNYGLVHRGLNLGLAYDYLKNHLSKLFSIHLKQNLELITIKESV